MGDLFAARPCLVSCSGRRRSSRGSATRTGGSGASCTSNGFGRTICAWARGGLGASWASFYSGRAGRARCPCSGPTPSTSPGRGVRPLSGAQVPGGQVSAFVVHVLLARLGVAIAVLFAAVGIRFAAVAQRGPALWAPLSQGRGSRSTWRDSRSTALGRCSATQGSASQRQGRWSQGSGRTPWCWTGWPHKKSTSR